MALYAEPPRSSNTWLARPTKKPEITSIQKDGRRVLSMNRKQLLAFREDLANAMIERQHLGDYDANSQYINFLLKHMVELTDHAISQYPKPQSIPTRQSPKQDDAKAKGRS
jgi:hypothetical protein